MRVQPSKPLVVMALTIVILVGVTLRLLGQSLGSVAGQILMDLGALLAVSVTVAVVWELMLRHEHDRRIERQIEAALEKQERASARDIQAAADRAVEGMARRIDELQPASLTYGLTRFVIEMKYYTELFDSLQHDDELLLLDTYSPVQEAFLIAMRRAIERGARIKMLLVDPDSDAAKWRADEIESPEYAESRFRDQAHLNLKKLVATASRVADHGLQIRLYSDLLCVPMFLIMRDGKAYRGFTSFYLTKPTFYMPHLEWKPTEQGLLADFVRYFESKWSANESNQLYPRLRTAQPSAEQ